LDSSAFWGGSLAARKDELTGFYGPLLLVVIGRVLAPFILAWNFCKAAKVYSSPIVWQNLMTPGSRAFHPLWPVVMFYEVAGHGVLFGTSLVLLWLMFARRRFFRIAIVLYMLGTPIFLWGDLILVGFLPLRHNPQTDSLIKAIFGTIAAGVWIGYFAVSQRVKNTFVR
jgi:Protein of unknown function (DUF2569)